MSTEITNLAEQAIIAWAGAIEAENAALAGDFVNTGLCECVNIVIITGDMNSQTAAVTLDCAATAAGGTTAVEFGYMWTNDGDVTSSQLVKTTVTSNTFNIDTSNAVYVIPIRSVDMPEEKPWLQLDIAAAGAGTPTYTACYIMTGLRYSAATTPEALA